MVRKSTIHRKGLLLHSSLRGQGGDVGLQELQGAWGGVGSRAEKEGVEGSAWGTRGEERRVRGLGGAGPSCHSGQGYSRADKHCFRGPIASAQRGCA